MALSNITVKGIKKSILREKLKSINLPKTPSKTNISVYELNKIRKVQPQQIKSITTRLQEKFTPLLSENFSSKKERLIQEFSKLDDKHLIEELKGIQTPERLAKLLAKQEAEYMRISSNILLENNFIKINPRSYSMTLSKAMPIELEQIRYGQMMKYADSVFAREKAMHVPSKNPQVIAIENILKEQYGAKFVSLKDNEVIAKQVLKAYETAAKNGIETPKNVIVSDFMTVDGINLLNGTILLNSHPKVFGAGYSSTNSGFHIPLHEIMHNAHPNLISFNTKKISDIYKETKNNLSGYSASMGTHETFTELNTKRLIDGLNPEETKLYNYLNIFG